MITQVYLENFQGCTGRYDLGNLTLISGRNGAGKSTILKSIQLLLLRTVPGDMVNDTVGEQFAYYCNNDAGSMTIEVVTDSCTVGRTWTKSKGKVSTQATRNGADIGANTDLLEASGVKIFNATDFWKMTPSKQINAICQLAGVDPDELEKIDESIEVVATEKSNAMDKAKAARSALKDHEREIQILVEEGRYDGDMNVSMVQKNIQNIEQKVDQLSIKINKAIELSSERKSKQERLAWVSSRCAEISDELEQLHIPTANVSTIELESELKRMDSLRTAFLQVKSIESRIQNLTRPEPPPVAVKESDIEDLLMKIRDAESGRGVSDEDKLGYEIGKKIFSAIRDLEPLINEEERKQCLGVVRDICGGYKANVEAASNLAPLEQVRKWKGQVESMRTTRRNYDMVFSEWAMNQREAKALKSDLADLAKVEFDQVEYDKIVNDLAARRQDASTLKAEIEKKERLEIESNKLAVELLELHDYLEKEAEESDIEAMREKRSELQSDYVKLRDCMRGANEYAKLDEIREKKHVEIDKLNKSIEALKAQEDILAKQKLDLLKTVQETISNRCDKITKPYGLEIELPVISKKNRSEKIKFFLVKDNGDRIERSTNGGAEGITMDIALGHALVGDGGLVLAEVAEFDAENMDLLVDKLLKSEVQTILAGHSLGRFEVNRNLTYICVDRSSNASVA